MKKDIWQEKNGLCLKHLNYPEWYKIVHPVLTDTNEGIGSVCLNPEVTYFGEWNFLPGDSDERSDEGETTLKKVGSSLTIWRN